MILMIALIITMMIAMMKSMMKNLIPEIHVDATELDDIDDNYYDHDDNND